MPVCPTAGCLSTNGQSYILIDGGGTGVVENTANGSGLANQLASNGIVADSSETMADNEKASVGAGFSLLWRRQGVLWWLFVVNVFLWRNGNGHRCEDAASRAGSQFGRTAFDQRL